jgi:hypothetical protein
MGPDPPVPFVHHAGATRPPVLERRSARAAEARPGLRVAAVSAASLSTGARPARGVEDRGPLLWEYSPPRAHPILYAGLLVFGFVLLTGSLEALVRGAPGRIYLLYAAPLVATALLFVLLMPGKVRIHEHGAAPGWRVVERPFRPAFVRWEDLAAVYPVHYDVTGAFVSPFASSDGKVTQMGLGLEYPDRKVVQLRFTPTRFALGSRQSRGFKEAIDVVRGVFARRGRPLVPPQPPIPDHERDELLARARKPFLPFFAIVFLFACAAPVTAVLAKAGVPDGAALALGVSVPLATSLLSWKRSRDRNRILNHLQRRAEAGRA